MAGGDSSKGLNDRSFFVGTSIAVLDLVRLTYLSDHEENVCVLSIKHITLKHLTLL